MPQSRIFIDLDDTLVDFTGTFLETYYPKLGRVFKDQIVTYDLFQHVKIGIGAECTRDREQFWSRIPAAFWRDLPWLHQGRKIIAWAQQHFREVYIATVPTQFSSSSEGKYQWVNCSLPPDMRKNFCITPYKHLLCRTGDVLIDDSPDNLRKWVEQGGSVIMSQQPWNRHLDYETVVDVIGVSRKGVFW